MTLGEFMKLVLLVTLSLSVPLAMLLGVGVIALSGASLRLDLDVGFATLDALWVLLTVPLVCLATTLLMAPLALPLFRRLYRDG